MTTSIKDRFELTGKVAIVTGASKGIGFSIAKGLAEFGAQVVLSSRKQEAIEQAASTLSGQGLKAKGLVCHVGRSEDRASMINTVTGQFGRIDILVNNAAVNPYYGPIEDIEMPAYQKTLDVNLQSVLELCNVVLPWMKKQGGSIINISSIEAVTPGNGMGAYSISKAALEMLTKSQAKEWGRYGIRVNCIAPGLVRTKFAAALVANDRLMQYMKKYVPVGREADPDEMAGLAVFLASGASSYCTGAVFTADGGFSVSGIL